MPEIESLRGGSRTCRHNLKRPMKSINDCGMEETVSNTTNSGCFPDIADEYDAKNVTNIVKD